MAEAVSEKSEKVTPKSIIGILISIGGIYWAFRDFHFAEFTASIQEVKIIYLVVCITFKSILFSFFFAAKPRKL